MKKPLRLKKIQQMSTHDLKSYAHDQAKRAKRLRDEMAKLGNRAAAAERAASRAGAELAVRAITDSIELPVAGPNDMIRLSLDKGSGQVFAELVPAREWRGLTGIPVSHHVV